MASCPMPLRTTASSGERALSTSNLTTRWRAESHARERLGRESERFRNVGRKEVRVGSQDLCCAHPIRNHRDDRGHGDACIPNAGNASHTLRICCNARIGHGLSSSWIKCTRGRCRPEGRHPLGGCDTSRHEGTCGEPPGNPGFPQLPKRREGPSRRRPIASRSKPRTRT